MRVGPEDIRRTADLAALHVGEDELPALARDVSRILDYVSRLAAAEELGSASFRPGPEQAPYRPDDIGPIPLNHAPDAFAPEFHDGFFVVPRLGGVGEGTASEHAGDRRPDG